jgi:hypothetical protein
VFLAVISLPLVCKLIHFELVSPVREFRAMRERPPSPQNLASLSRYPEKFEGYFNDHFGLRSVLIRGMHLTKGRWLGVSTADNVLRGREGWLYFTQRPAGTDYDAVRPFTDAELAQWGRVLEARRCYLAQQGIDYVVFVPPDKQTIYPEHLPKALRSRHHQSRLDQLAAYLREHTQVSFLDVRPQLVIAKQQERIYHVTDSHWNDRGAFVGYQALCGKLAEHDSRLRPLPRSAFLDVALDEPGGDLAQMVALENVRHEESLRLVPLSARFARPCDTAVSPPRDCPLLGIPYATVGGDSSHPRAVMFHDSFTWALAPFLSEHFHRAVFLWTDQFSCELVEREHPNIVIQELVERKLGFVSPIAGDQCRTSF